MIADLNVDVYADDTDQQHNADDRLHKGHLLRSFVISIGAVENTAPKKKAGQFNIVRQFASDYARCSSTHLTFCVYK